MFPVGTGLIQRSHGTAYRCIQSAIVFSTSKVQYVRCTPCAFLSIFFVFPSSPVFVTLLLCETVDPSAESELSQFLVFCSVLV